MELVFFCEPLDHVYEEKCQELRRYIDALPESDFDVVDRPNFCELAIAKFGLSDMPQLTTDEIERDEPEFTQGSQAVHVTVYIPFRGEGHLFQLFHSSRPVPSPVFEVSNGLLKKKYRLDKEHMHRLDDLVNADIGLLTKHLDMAQDMVPRFNKSMLDVAGESFDRRVKEIKENKLASSHLAQSQFTVRKRSDGTDRIIVPVQRKPIHVTGAAKVDPVREYVLGMTEYNDILATISSMAMVMERSPSVFAAMNEEPLRTILLVALNGIYEGQASGETFNGHGKTDILIRREDRNVFIAECLMWKGAEYLKGKMDGQLFQYAMWRDSKLALIVFNRGGNFTNVVSKMKETVRSHPQFQEDLNWSHESGARYMFRRHDDPQRHFILSAVAFDVPVS